MPQTGSDITEKEKGSPSLHLEWIMYLNSAKIIKKTKKKDVLC